MRNCPETAGKGVTVAAWENFYQEYGKSVYRFLLSITGSEDEAEELLQETFYQAFLHIEQFEGRCSPYTWLCQIGKNAWMKECKRKKRFAERDVPETEHADPSATPEEYAVARDTRERVRGAVYQLEEPYKEVLMLHVYGELKLKEIAEAFGKTESWARVTYYRAREKLAMELQDYDIRREKSVRGKDEGNAEL